MPQDRHRATRLAATAVGILVLFNFPFLAVFDSDQLVAGVPLLWAYLFVVWGLVIGLIAWVVRS